MLNFLKKYSILFFILTGINLSAQQDVITVGIQYKPIFQGQIFNTGEQISESGAITTVLSPKIGSSFGMVIRRGFTKMISAEIGINYINRNFDFSIDDQLNQVKVEESFKLIGYEIPLSMLIYIRLGDKLFMNASGGISFDMFPSDLATNDRYFHHVSYRYRWIRNSVIANLGWEWRTDKSGYFYLGGSFHRPFKPIIETQLTYIDDNNYRTQSVFDVLGNYLTIDFRYFFHEDEQKAKKKKKKKK